MLHISLTTEPYLTQNAGNVEQVSFVILVTLPIFFLPAASGLTDVGDKLRDGCEGFLHTFGFEVFPDAQ